MARLLSASSPATPLPSYLNYRYENNEALNKSDTQFMLAMDRLIFRISFTFNSADRRTRVIQQIVNAINDRADATDLVYEQLLSAAQLPVLSEAREVRAEHINQYWKYAWRPALVGFLLVFAWLAAILHLQYLYRLAKPFDEGTVGTIVKFVGAMGFALWGLVVGAAFSIYLTNRRLTIENFDQIQRYHLSIKTYFSWLYLLTFLIFLLLVFQVVVLGLGPIILNDVAGKPYYGLLVGMLCVGLANLSLPISLFRL